MTALIERASAHEHPVEGQRPYQPHGAAEFAFYYQGPELILDGPANTGKSRGCLEKLHLVASKYAGTRALMLRKTRRELTESALVTYEQKVLPEGSPICAGASRWTRHAYQYPNGSELVCGGLDNADKVFSTEWDVVYVQEAREISEHDWESLLTRIRNHKMPYQQLLGDTNPDAPTHWIKQRANRGQLKLVPSRHADNPALRPDDMEKLDALTGVRYKRLRQGLWVSAEGMVYADSYDSAVNVIEMKDLPGGAIPASWPRLLSVDFGYTNPFCCQWWALDPDGRLYRYRELYMTQRLVEEHARQIKEESRGERIRGVICDHDAEDRATLAKHLGMGNVAAKKDISPGIQAVAARFRKAGDGKPRLFLLRDSLLERDPWLVERKLPCCTEEEIESYIWARRRVPLASGEVREIEEPIDKDNHGLDAMRYMVATLDLRAEDRVLKVKTSMGGE